MMNRDNNSYPNRRVQRSYHCYGCQNEWLQLVNPSDLTGVQCPTCACEFFEETNSYSEQVSRPQEAENSQPEEPVQQQAQPQPVENVQLPVRQETEQMGPNGGWTRSVTITYGTGDSEPRVSSYSMGTGPQRPTSAQRPPQAAEPSMDEFFSGSGFFGGHQQRREGVPEGLFESMFRGQNPFVSNRVFMQQPRQQPQSQGCSTDFIANLPQKEEGKESDCYICLEKCSDGETSCQLPCNHAFDRACIQNWLKENDTCPVCRTKLDEANASNRRAEAQNQRQQASGPQLNNFFFF